jgi:phospholipid/cholesterol/gamma-HCH transport system substrate-binding protein
VADVRLIALLCLVLALSGCGLSFQQLPIGSQVSGESYRVTLVFDDVTSLPVGGQVKVGQAVVGRVESLEAKDFTAYAHVRLERSVRLPRTVLANIEVATAIGEQFVNLTVPRGQDVDERNLLRDGDVVGPDQTSHGPVVEDIFAVIGTVLGGSGLEKLATVVREANTALGGREQEVRELLGELDTVLGTVDAHQADINAALDSMSTLTTTIADERDSLDTAVREVTPAVQVLISQQDTFTALLTHLDSLSSATRGVLDSTQTQIVDVVRGVRPTLEELAGMNDELAAMLQSMNAFAPLYQRGIPGDYLQTDLEVNVPETLTGILAGIGGGSAVLPGASPPPAGGLGDLLGGGGR